MPRVKKYKRLVPNTKHTKKRAKYAKEKGGSRYEKESRGLLRKAMGRSPYY